MSAARMVVRFLSDALSRKGTLYGDIASMHAGPCERCVGRALRDEELTEPTSDS